MFRRLLWFALCFAAASLPAEDWYLISEMELRNIEQYKESNEREKANWLLQVNGLKTQAERLNERAANSLAALETLNQQLVAAREQNKTLQQSYEQSEAENLTHISLKNGEIAELKQEMTIYKRQAALRLVISISLGATIIGYIAFRVLRFFL
jgi:hypothetical protein